MDRERTTLPSNKPGEAERFEILDGLRGIAALIVLFAHASSAVHAAQYFEKKSLAVYFFFMLSGFVVACAYEKRLSSGMPVAQFYIRRLIRLYPLMFLGTLFSIIYLVTFNPAFVVIENKYVAAAFSFAGLPYLNSPPTELPFPINPPQWSLFYELLAYLVYGLIAVHLKTWRLISCTVISIVLFAIGMHNHGDRSTFLITQVFAAASSFSIGILLWRLHEKKKIKAPAVPFWLLALLIAGPCALKNNFSYAFDVLIVITVFPMAILMGAAHGGHNSAAVTRTLGDLSYPLYILHWPCIMTVTLLMGFMQPRVTTMLGCVASVTLAWLALKFFDIPVRGYLTRKLASRAVARALQINAISQQSDAQADLSLESIDLVRN